MLCRRKLELNGPIEKDLQESRCRMWRILEIRVSERGESCCGFWLKLGLQSCYS